MQTFLPLPKLMASAIVLDDRRLGKQRVEALQIIQALTGKTSNGKPSRWLNHPAVRMWRGYESALVLYGLVVCAEWVNRGFKDTCFDKILAFDPDILSNIDSVRSSMMPPWFGDDSFHASHRSNLLRKDPTHYGRLGWTEPPDIPYVWPL